MTNDDQRNTDGSCPNKVGDYTQTFKKIGLSDEETAHALERQKASLLPEDKQEVTHALQHCLDHPGYTTMVLGIACDGVPSDDGELCTSMAIAGPMGTFPATSVLMGIEMLARTVTQQMLKKGEGPGEIQEEIIDAIKRGVRESVIEAMGPFGGPSNPLIERLKGLFEDLKVKDLPQKDQPFKDLEA